VILTARSTGRSPVATMVGGRGGNRVVGAPVCGLMGFVSGTGQAQARVTAIAAGMRCARHRGPDDAGTWHDDDVVFGFNRLSIIDIEHSHQPLRWGPPEAPDRYALVFNGEIYNYL
jgi:asparagine synthase (glutamine-hydrolysing)